MTASSCFSGTHTTTPTAPRISSAHARSSSPASAPGLIAAAPACDLAWAEGILGAVGVVVRVPEKQLDAVTGLSGSGPAYVFVVAEAMAEAGARLLVEGGDSPAALRAAVTSPGGTTAAGLRELERHGVRAAFLEAVTAAAERSRELGA